MDSLVLFGGFEAICEHLINDTDFLANSEVEAELFMQAQNKPHACCFCEITKDFVQYAEKNFVQYSEQDIEGYSNAKFGLNSLDSISEIGSNLTLQAQNETTICCFCEMGKHFTEYSQPDHERYYLARLGLRYSGSNNISPMCIQCKTFLENTHIEASFTQKKFEDYILAEHGVLDLFNFAKEFLDAISLKQPKTLREKIILYFFLNKKLDKIFRFIFLVRSIEIRLGLRQNRKNYQAPNNLTEYFNAAQNYALFGIEPMGFTDILYSTEF